MNNADFGRGDVNRYNAQFIHTFSPDSAFEFIAWYHRSFREFLDATGYAYAEETGNPAYRLFAGGNSAR